MLLQLVAIATYVGWIGSLRRGDSENLKQDESKCIAAMLQCSICIRDKVHLDHYDWFEPNIAFRMVGKYLQAMILVFLANL